MAEDALSIFDEHQDHTIRTTTLTAYCAVVAAQHYQDLVGAPYVYRQPEEHRLEDNMKRWRSWLLWSRADEQGLVLG